MSNLSPDTTLYSLNFLFSRISIHLSLTHSSQKLCSRPLTSLVALLWTHSSPPMSFPIWGSQDWTQHSRCCTTSAVHRVRITDLVLLATPFLIQAVSHWPSTPPGHTAGSCPACCPSVPKWAFLSGHCPATLSSACSTSGVVVAKGQDPALGLVKPHHVGFGPWIQPVQVPLQTSPTLLQIHTPSHLGVTTVP